MKSASTTATTATAANRPGPCRAGEMVLTYLGGQGATGHGDLGFALRNKSGRTCHTSGYPAVRFVDRSGKPLPTAWRGTTEDFFGRSRLRRLAVAPGRMISFRLDVSHGSGSPKSCPTAAALQVIPPRDTHTLSALITNGAYECGKADVSPLQPGASAYPRPGA